MLNSFVSVNSRFTKLNFPHLGSQPKKKGKETELSLLGLTCTLITPYATNQAVKEILVEIRCLKALM